MPLAITTSRSMRAGNPSYGIKKMDTLNRSCLVFHQLITRDVETRRAAVLTILGVAVSCSEQES